MTKIGGLEKVSLLDYPDKLSAIIFTYGCNLRCSFCHNPELVIHDYNSNIEVKEKYLFEYLKRRRGKLDAVVITGGEPLIYDDIEILIRKIKELGYLLKLDTNGFFPSKLKSLLDRKLLDYIAMDIKYSPKEYSKQTGDKNALEKIKESIKIIKHSKVDYEFRTTFVKGIHKIKDASEIAKIIKNSKKYYIQNFRAGKTIDHSLDYSNSFTQDELELLLYNAKLFVKNSYIR